MSGTEEEDVVGFKAWCKGKARKEERKVEEKEEASQIWRISLCSSLHSILGRSCSSGRGWLNLGNRWNKSWWGNLLLFLVSNSPSSLSSRLAALPCSPLTVMSGAFKSLFASVLSSLCLLFISFLALGWTYSSVFVFPFFVFAYSCIYLAFSPPLQPWPSLSVSFSRPSHLCTSSLSLSLFSSLVFAQQLCASLPLSVSVCLFYSWLFICLLFLPQKAYEQSSLRLSAFFSPPLLAF